MKEIERHRNVVEIMTILLLINSVWNGDFSNKEMPCIIYPLYWKKNRVSQCTDTNQRREYNNWDFF